MTFSSPVSNFSLLVTNVMSGHYLVTDNLGGSSASDIFQNSQTTITLKDSGITSVTIRSTRTVESGLWDFAIDNVSFTPSAVPEPSSLAMCGLAGAIGAAYAWRRRKRAT
jgi:PEP-CTERM motif